MGTAGQLQQAQQAVLHFPASAGGQIVSLTGQHSILLLLLEMRIEVSMGSWAWPQS